MTTLCLNFLYCICLKLIIIWIFEEIIGSRYTSIEAAVQIHICNATAVTGEVVMIHSFNVSRSISSCSCWVKWPPDVDVFPIVYMIQSNSQNCGIKFSLDGKTEFSCESDSVKRSPRRIQFSRNRNANARASLQIRVGNQSHVYVRCGMNISKHFSDHSDDQENQADEENEDSKEDKGNNLPPVNSVKRIHVCDDKTVIGQEIVLLNFNVPRSIRACRCKVTLPTEIDTVSIRYTIPLKQEACGIHFVLDSTREFLCEEKNVTRSNLDWILFSRDRSSTANADLQLNVEDGAQVTVRCGIPIAKYNDSIDEEGSQSDKKDGTNDGADGGLPDPTETVPVKSVSGDNINKDTGVIIGGSVSAVVVAVIIGGLFGIRRHFRNKVKKEDSADITEETAMHSEYSQLGDVTITTATNGNDAVVTYNAMYNVGLPDTVPNTHHTDESNELIVTYNAVYNVDIPNIRIFHGQTGVTVTDTPVRAADSSSKIYHEIKDSEGCSSIPKANANQLDYEKKSVMSAQDSSRKERPSQIYHDINVHEMDITKQDNFQGQADYKERPSQI